MTALISHGKFGDETHRTTVATSSATAASVPLPVASSSKNQYSDEWISLFEKSSGICLDELRKLCFSGSLQGSRFRSVVWRILLHCLPLDKHEWEATLAKSRAHYAILKEKMNLDPRTCDPKLTPSLNNPLSLEDESPWQQYFLDTDLKSCIQQDVERTFPELEYFQSADVRQLMVDILFVFAKIYPEVSYKQGMHEILGPLLFVLFFDQQSFSHAEEQECEWSSSSWKSLLNQVMNPTFFEHDAFAMFSKIMMIIQPWYCSPERNRCKDRMMEARAEPFSRVQDADTSNVLVAKLNHIGDDLLAPADPPLSKHLQALEIPPQIYGIRWLRLLFGREFPIQDLLFLWDAVFADGAPFLLVDFIFVAMLIFIRDLLLNSDYTGCLHYVMRYPPVTDVHSLLALALHLRDPTHFAKPKIPSSMNFSHITVAGRPHPNLAQAKTTPSKVLASNVSLPAVMSKNLERTGTKVLKSINKVGNIVADSLKEPENGQTGNIRLADGDRRPEGLVGIRSAGSSPRNTKRLEGGARYFAKPGLLSEDEHDLLKEQVSCLQVRLSDLESSSQIAAQRLCLASDIISAELRSLGALPENDAFGAVAEVRHISRVLSGSSRLRLTETLGRSPVEMGRDAASALQTPDSSQPPLDISPTNLPPAAAGSLASENELKEIT